MAVVTKLNGFLGARIDGIDFATGLSEQDQVLIRSALAEHHVVCVSAAAMSPAQHTTLACFFGTPEEHSFFNNLGEGAETITVLDSTVGDRADMWHSDEQFLRNPPTFTLTQAKTLPPYGGETAFISLCAVYESLSHGLQRYLEGLTAVHDYAQIVEMSWQLGLVPNEQLVQAVSASQWAEHPLVIDHPPSGRRTLFLSPTYTRFIKGLPMGEAKMLQEFLLHHMLKPEFQYRHRWIEGDLMIWDNRCTLHYALNDYQAPRRMHRISVMADQAE